MNNKQLAAARRAINQFPGARVIKDGETIIPVMAGVQGEPVTVTEAMSKEQVQFELTSSCEAIA